VIVFDIVHGVDVHVFDGVVGGGIVYVVVVVGVGVGVYGLLFLR
jgi:hypothetical protein